MASTRRRFVLATLATGGALAIGWSLAPPRQRLRTARPLEVAPGQVALNGWVKLHTDGTVTVMQCKAEMGQGVSTAAAMLLAEEMDADWSRVVTQTSPLDKIYGAVSALADGLPFHPDDTGTLKRFAGWMTTKVAGELGFMMTGGSSSVKDLWTPMRQAGAAARLMLIGAAARQWGVPPSECRTEPGVVLHSSGRRLGFGELAQKAAEQAFPESIPLKDPAAFRLIGQPLARKDSADKLTGRATFGIDVLPQGLLYASVVMCPTLGGRVAKVDDAQALKLPGVRKVLRVEAAFGSTAGVAVIADTMPQVLKGLAALHIDWEAGTERPDSAALIAQLRARLDSAQGHVFFETGQADDALKGAAKTVSADYEAPWLTHAPMEPMNCTVQVGVGVAQVWAPTQVPGIARHAVAKLMGLDDEQVQLHMTLLGGGFGRRLDVDFVAQAAAIARAMPGRPVQTVWSREQDMTHDFYRPACVSRFKAGLDAQGRLVALTNLSVGQAITPQVMQRSLGLPGGGPDKTTSEGAFDQAYEWPAARIAHEAVELSVPVGYWRSVGHSHQAFFKESFVDECAHAAGADPVAFRAALLQKHPRHLAVLQRAAKLAAWGTPLAPTESGAPRSRGVALHTSFGTTVAQVVEVSLGPDKTPRVHRVVCVVDCGIAINPQLIRQQMESSVVFALSAALYGEITLVQGQVQQSNFHQQRVLRMSECPEVVVDIIASHEPPEGVGEPGVPPLAPALANALFALTGQRLRRLPLRVA